MGRRRKRSGSDHNGQLVLLALVVIVGIAGLIWQYWKERQREADPATAPPPVVVTPPDRPTTAPPTPPPPSGVADVSDGQENLLLGNPSRATSDPSNRANYLMVKPYYALSYNDVTGTPNWVSWRVARADLGDAPRKQLFDADETLPQGFKRVTHKDYSNSGFDRGHLCPNADRDAATEMNHSTFLMTNIIPQAPNVNQKAWAEFEGYCRGLVSGQRARLYVVAGPTGRGGRGSAGFRETIAGGKVTVPAECWKVVVVVPEAGNADDLSKVSTDTRVIALVMPNDNNAVTDDDWARYRTSVADVERRTGLRFFDRLPADVAQALKSKVDAVTVPVSGARGTRGTR